jgi:RimJ/RimL family protein N-acetyltransferase
MFTLACLSSPQGSCIPEIASLSSPKVSMNPEIVIRSLDPSDARALRILRLEALRDAPEAFGASYEEEASVSVETFQTRLSSSGPNAVFGAFAGRNLVGMAGFAVYERMKASHKGVMWGVFVKPEWRGQGISKALVQRVIDHAARHVIMLEAAVGLTNESARRTYHGLGFKPYGIERKALRIGDRFIDEELLCMDLPHWDGS